MFSSSQVSAACDGTVPSDVLTLSDGGMKRRRSAFLPPVFTLSLYLGRIPSKKVRGRLKGKREKNRKKENINERGRDGATGGWGGL